MTKLYTEDLTKKDEHQMKKPKKSTLNFLRSFARAYTALPAVGALILN